MSHEAFFVVFYNPKKPHKANHYKITSSEHLAPRKGFEHMIVERATGHSYEDARENVMKKITNKIFDVSE